MIPALRAAQHEQNQVVEASPILVLPGFGAGDLSTLPLRRFLGKKGFRTVGWGFGINRAGLNLPHRLEDISAGWGLEQKHPYKGDGGVAYLSDRVGEHVARRHWASIASTCDPAAAAVVTKRLGAESLLALSQTLLRRGGTAPPNMPLHFFGAEGDFIIPAAEVRRTAQRFGAPVTIYPGMSHTFQVENDWRTICGDIQNWLADIGLEPLTCGQPAVCR